MYRKYLSRKFIVWVVGIVLPAVVIFIPEAAGLDPDKVADLAWNIVSISIAYLAAEGGVDVAAVLRTPKDVE